MSDVVTLARLARESLARGLSALQDPHIPPQLAELAAPIAQAMGALHQIERSGGAQVMPGAQTALTNIQGVLTQLQMQPPQHPAVMAAMEAVAGALGNVHSLTRYVPAAAPQPARAQAPQAAAYAQPPAAAYAQPQAQPAAYAQPAYPQPAQQQPQPRGAYAAQPAPVAQAPAASPRGAAPRADGAIVAAELGAHSQTNFYKGLSGNDIIDHGGLFVSTYKLPKIGQPVRLKVSLPGGYEFEANAVVRWCREQSEAGNDAPPGFGAQFVEITPEARQLVYRYVRNREPMFHDDL
ncbi:MAG: PilZ domain-containing protein [Polyangiaceae bacterium]